MYTDVTSLHVFGLPKDALSEAENMRSYRNGNNVEATTNDSDHKSSDSSY